MGCQDSEDLQLKMDVLLKIDLARCTVIYHILFVQNCFCSYRFIMG